MQGFQHFCRIYLLSEFFETVSCFNGFKFRLDLENNRWLGPRRLFFYLLFISTRIPYFLQAPDDFFKPSFVSRYLNWPDFVFFPCRPLEEANILSLLKSQETLIAKTYLSFGSFGYECFYSFFMDFNNLLNSSSSEPLRGGLNGSELVLFFLVAGCNVVGLLCDITDGVET